MKWAKVNKYYLTFGNTNWTMTWADNVPLPFSLFQGEEHRGSFATMQQAVDKHRELSQHA